MDLHEAQDLDGVIGKLDDIQTEFAKVHLSWLSSLERPLTNDVYAV